MNPKPNAEALSGLEQDIITQFELERWWVEDCRRRDVEYAEVLRKRGSASSDRGVRHLLTKESERLAVEIENRIGAPAPGKRVMRKETRLLEELVKSVEPFELAYLVLAQTANIVLTSNKGFITMAALGTYLADALEEEIRYRAMERIRPELPRLVRKVLKDSRASLKHRRRVFTTLFHRKTSATIPPFFKDMEDRLRVGNLLVELILTGPGKSVGTASRQYDPSKRDMRWVIKPSDTLREVLYREGELDWLAKRVTPLGILTYAPGKKNPALPEMLITKDPPPLKVNPLSGKSQKNIETLIEKDYGYTALLNCLTYLEGIPLRVNRTMLDWIKLHRDELRRIGALHNAEVVIPDCPVLADAGELSPEDEERLKDWKRHAESLHNKHWKERVQVVKDTRTIELASKLAKYDRLYYRWYADFRGRLYPVNTLLNFQGTSLAKSLLEFAEEATLKVGEPDDIAWRELVEYGLRLLPALTKEPAESLERFLDRTSLQGLVNRLNAGYHEDLIEMLGKKNFLPYVAWVLEIQRLLPLWGQEATSGHPIRRDATCSSMQHMAALAGDINVLRATNCTSDVEHPGDLYTAIVPEYEALGLSRDQIKKFIMTYAYNSTDYQRKIDIRTEFENKHGYTLPYEEVQAMNDALKEAAKKGLGKIVPFQKLLMDVFTLLVSRNKELALSITLTDFVVDSTKVEMPARRFVIKGLDANIKIQVKNLNPDQVKTNIRKTRQSWVANIIHSMDACLFHLVLNCLQGLSLEQRLHIAPIHDCAVTRPGDMTETVTILAGAFRVMYCPNPKSGIPQALHKLVEFWCLKDADPQLCRKFLDFQAVPSETFKDMKYFFI